jgi:hypothetical protein
VSHSSGKTTLEDKNNVRNKSLACLLEVSLFLLPLKISESNLVGYTAQRNSHMKTEGMEE